MVDSGGCVCGGGGGMQKAFSFVQNTVHQFKFWDAKQTFLILNRSTFCQDDLKNRMNCTRMI